MFKLLDKFPFWLILRLNRVNCFPVGCNFACSSCVNQTKCTVCREGYYVTSFYTCAGEEYVKNKLKE